jgi:hypothetical protein
MGYCFPGENKYRDLVLISLVELRPEKGCAGNVQQKNENYIPDFSSERASHISKSVSVQK